METQGLSFPEAVERLAAMAGLAMPVETPEARAQEKRRATTLEALEMAAEFFERQLRSPAGARARAYLAGRGLDDECARKVPSRLCARTNDSPCAIISPARAVPPRP